MEALPTVKIEIEIPEWAIGRHINVFAGVELLAQMFFNVKKVRNEDNSITRERKYEQLKLKPNDGRCTGCSDCCNDGGPSQLQLIYETIKEKGYKQKEPCPMLTPSGCGLGAAIPFSCASSNCEGWSKYCTEKLVAINDGIQLDDVITLPVVS